MTPFTLDLMRGILEHRIQPGWSVIDVGSYDVNGTHNAMLAELGLRYLGGIDVRSGPNVRWVVSEIGDWRETVSVQADVTISGSCLEHVGRPWEWIGQVVSVTKPKGLVVVIAPWQWPIHEHPVDCWRVLPDGMRALFEFGGLQQIETGIREEFTFGIGWKEKR